MAESHTAQTTEEPIYGRDCKDYNVHFDAESYLKRFDAGSQRYVHKIGTMEELHHFFKAGDHRGNLLLDLCSGPSIHAVISASKFYKQIYLTDYAVSSREALRKWTSRDKEAYDWTPYFQMVANYEGNGITAADVEKRVRESIKGILPCDLTAEKPLGQGQGRYARADAIISSLTIDVVASDEKIFLDCLKKFCDLLGRGGVLCLIGFQSGSFFSVEDGGKKFVAAAYPVETVERMLSEAGFFNINFKDIITPEYAYCDCKGCYFVSAIKK